MSIKQRMDGQASFCSMLGCNLSPQLPVHEMKVLDAGVQATVSELSTSFYTPGDLDEVWLQSFSTTGGTWCHFWDWPTLCLQRLSMDGTMADCHLARWTCWWVHLWSACGRSAWRRSLGAGTGLVVVVVEATVVDVFVVRYLGGNSSSESSELGTGGGLLAATGSGGGSAADSGAEESTRCFFFGSGVSTGWARLERTGTGVVVRVVVLGYSGPETPHFGDFPTGVEDGLPTFETGFNLTPFGEMMIGICLSLAQGWLKEGVSVALDCWPSWEK